MAVTNQCPKCREVFSPANFLIHRCSAAQPGADKASPRPWAIDSCSRAGWMQIADANGKLIIDVNSSDGMDEATAFPDEANAELIVRSVNQSAAFTVAYDALSRALDDFRSLSKESSVKAARMKAGEAYQRVRAALKAVEELRKGEA